MLEMLIYFDGICRKNNLQYWLDFGTLLGAVRHGGFIPWDDDLDIAMLRKDAEKLYEILKKDNNDNFVLQCHSTDPHYYLLWNKIRDLKSANVAHSYVQNRLKFKGLQIDIFIMDYNVNDRLKSYSWYLYCWLVDRPLNDNCGIWKNMRCTVNISYFFIKRFILPVLRRISKIFSHNNYLSYSYGIPYCNKFELTDIFPLKEICFEGHMFFVPYLEDKYLKELYGNWRSVPQEDEIETHNTQLEFYF